MKVRQDRSVHWTIFLSFALVLNTAMFAGPGESASADTMPQSKGEKFGIQQKNSAMRITSDSLVHHLAEEDEEGTPTKQAWTQMRGNVRAQDNEMDLNCDELQLYHSSDKQTDRIVAIAIKKPVVMKVSRTSKDGTVEVTTIIGRKLTYQGKTGDVTAEGSPKVVSHDGTTTTASKSITYSKENGKISTNGTVEVIIPQRENGEGSLISLEKNNQ
jgi:lipopolysaccharide export system protein LptA